MIVEGQTLGGAAQGIGTALFEEMAFDANGQPQASTLADYMLPGATDMPRITIHHLDFYNGRRPHSSLDRRTPDQVYFTPLPIRMAA
jgi:CO/xanthine dehydrogenase Mo-binding subunit